ncbi:MAG: VanZ family protein, partial [Calditrichia bacterium]|nr:VanZ family protein [Calditrichia bacterium]
MKTAFELKAKFKKIFTLQWTVSKILLLLYFVFLFYVTFKPFNFKPVWGVFEGQFYYFWNTISFFKETVLGTKSDVIANIIVFIPFGSLLYWYKWEKNNFEKKVNWFKGILIIFGTTALIEFGQLFLPSRHPSIVDIITNLTGGTIGFIIVSMLIGSYKDFLYFINQLIHEKWDVKLFIVFVFIIFFYAWFPLSFSVNLWQVKHHLRFFIYSPIQLMNMLNAIPYLILFFYLQLLILEIIEKYFTVKNILLKFLIAISIVLTVSGIQFFGQSFVRGRLYNVEDLLMVFIGILAGTIFAYNLYLKKGLIFDTNNNYLLIILKITLLLNVIFILGASLFPFSWELKY